MNNSPDISVVIPNFNGTDLLTANIPHVIESLEYYRSALHPQSAEYEIILVDDASTDDSVKRITEQFPQVKIIQHALNQGYATAVYSGISSASHEVILLLNSDVKPRTNFLPPLVNDLGSPDIFSVSPTILDENDMPIQASWNRPTLHHGRIKMEKWDARRISQKDFVASTHPHLFASGGSMVLKRSRFLELGGFLDVFRPFYYEDMDLGIRAWRRGWKTLFNPTSVVIHPQGSTIRKLERPRKVKRVMQRNRLLVQWLHVPTKALLISHCPNLALRYLEHLLRLNTVEIASLCSALSKLGAIIRHRRGFKRSDKHNLTEVIELIQKASEAHPH